MSTKLSMFVLIGWVHLIIWDSLSISEVPLKAEKLGEMVLMKHCCQLKKLSFDILESDQMSGTISAEFPLSLNWPYYSGVMISKSGDLPYSFKFLFCSHRSLFVSLRPGSQGHSSVQICLSTEARYSELNRSSTVELQIYFLNCMYITSELTSEISTKVINGRRSITATTVPQITKMEVKTPLHL